MMEARAPLFVAASAALLATAGVALVVMPTAYQPYLLPGLLAALLAVVAGLGVWRRPALGVAATVLLIAVPFGQSEEGGSVSVTAPDLAAVALVALVALRVLVVGDGGRLRSWVVLPLAGVVAAGSVATMTAAEPGASLIGMLHYAEIFAVIPLVTYLSIRDRGDLRLILYSLVGLGLIEGAIGVYQYFTDTGADYGESASRAVGTFGAYGILGMAQVVAYALIVSVAAFAVLRRGRRFSALILVAGLALPLAFSFSRGYWIAAILGAMTAVGIASRRMLLAFVLAGGLALWVAAGVSGDGPNSLSERLTSIFSSTSTPDQSVEDRYAMWEAARGMWHGEPLTGVGIKNFPLFRDTYAPASFSGGSDISDPEAGYRRVELLSPHSLYWLILSEQGLVGALAYGTLFLGLGVAGLRRVLKMGDHLPTEKTFGLACLGLLSCYLISSVYNDFGGVTEILNAVFLGGLAWLASGIELEEAE